MAGRAASSPSFFFPFLLPGGGTAMGSPLGDPPAAFSFPPPPFLFLPYPIATASPLPQQKPVEQFGSFFSLFFNLLFFSLTWIDRVRWRPEGKEVEDMNATLPLLSLWCWEIRAKSGTADAFFSLFILFLFSRRIRGDIDLFFIMGKSRSDFSPFSPFLFCSPGPNRSL